MELGEPVTNHRIQCSGRFCLSWGKIPARGVQFKTTSPLFQVREFGGKPSKVDFSVRFCWLILIFFTTHKGELLLKFMSSHLLFCFLCVFFTGKLIISIMRSLTSILSVLPFLLSFSFARLLICRHLNLNIAFLPQTRQPLKLNS